MERAFADVRAIGGGCVHPAVSLRSASGRRAFLKWGRAAGFGGFGVEARGLAALSAADGPRVPSVLAFEVGNAAARGWILMEYIEPGRPKDRTWALLGSALARLHSPIEEAHPGWEEDGFIGPLPQSNVGLDLPWPDFWRDARLLPGWESVHSCFDRKTRLAWDRLMQRIGPALAGSEPDGLSLLHGDLWSGNVLTDTAGEPVLVDPSVYRGHREVDLAMMELFGGFDSGVLAGYREEAPVAEGYETFRRDVYQLYPLLVHVKLFGASYAAGVRERVLRLLSRLG